ncbi:MAG: hypothetical protein R2932_17625 [Caldilineaceae bacterium]
MIDSTIDSIGLMTVVWLIVLWLFGRSLLLKLVGLLCANAEGMRLFGMVLLIVFSGGQIYHRLSRVGAISTRSTLR